MRYLGSKRRFMKQLTPILMEHVDENTVFIDAFCGGANVISEIPHHRKWAFEINYYIVALWKHLRENGIVGIPDNVSEEMYYDVKRDYLTKGGKYPSYIIGYVGACCSYGSAWFNSYARYNPKKNEDHIREAYRGLKKHVESFKYLDETVFMCESYRRIESLQRQQGQRGHEYRFVIYCDPPYAGKKKYESDFDNDTFWEWVRYMSKIDNVYVYVSEYEAPSDFKCIWSQVKSDGLRTTKNGEKQKKEVERLFVYDK